MKLTLCEAFGTMPNPLQALQNAVFSHLFFVWVLVVLGLSNPHIYAKYPCWALQPLKCGFLPNTLLSPSVNPYVPR